MNGHPQVVLFRNKKSQKWNLIFSTYSYGTFIHSWLSLVGDFHGSWAMALCPHGWPNGGMSWVVCRVVLVVDCPGVVCILMLILLPQMELPQGGVDHILW